MNKKNVLTCAGGGGACSTGLHNGRDTFISNNNRRSSRDNAAIAHRQH